MTLGPVRRFAALTVGLPVIEVRQTRCSSLDSFIPRACSQTMRPLPSLLAGGLIAQSPSIARASMRTIRILAAYAGLGLVGAARADLQWQEQRLLLEPPVGAAEAIGVFEFVNRGRHTIRVVDVRAECGCTVIAPEKDEVLPGEKGRIRAVFQIGSREGRQSVGVSVVTHEPEMREYKLTLDVAIKPFVTLTPRWLYWKVGDDSEGKILLIRMVDGFKFVAAESTSPEFSVEVVAPADDAVQLRVKPRDTWAKREGSIKVRVAPPAQPELEVLAAVRVF